MSESYTVNGDTWIRLERKYAFGQTFLAREAHTLLWIDLDMKIWTPMCSPWVKVFNADINGEPFGAELSRSLKVWIPGGLPLREVRARFYMSPVTLDKGGRYVMVVRQDPPLGEFSWEWRCDETDGEYPRGFRVEYDPVADDWEAFHSQDFLFVEFGTPPAIYPPPDPPMHNVAIPGIEQFYTPTGVILVLTTSTPCHLYMLWTHTEPEKHKTPRLRRGIAFSDAIKYCFVNWHQNEQIEAGDTLYHTFIKEPWAICETRWFTFRSQVEGAWTPSVGPIFKKHKTAYLPVVPIKHFDCSPVRDFTLTIDKWNHHGATFTLDKQIILDKVTMLLAKTLTSEATNLWCTIYHTLPSGRPIGPPIVSKAVDVSWINRAPLWSEVTFPFDETVLLSPETRYIVWLTAVDAWPVMQVIWSAAHYDPCPLSSIVRYRFDIDQWYFFPTWDADFAVWGHLLQ